MQKKYSSVSFVSPVFNDAATLSCVLSNLEKLAATHFPRWEIVLIDDGSSDGSRQWLKTYIKGKKHIRVFFHKENLGIAKTYRELYRKAKNYVVVLFSLDGEWDPADAIRLVKTLVNNNQDIVVGVRRNKSYTLWRKIVSVLYNRLTRIFFSFATQDAGSIKAMKKEVIRSTPIISRGVFDEAERLIRAHAAGNRIGFITVSHGSTKKIRRGIRPSHVVEAFFDMVRVARDFVL